MNQKLLQFLRERPQVYAESTNAFWDDEHISKSMLKNHINPNADGATRNYAFVKKSAAWICSLAAPVAGKKLLDLGCGAGVYAELFAKYRFSVTGIDFSKRSIDYAKSHANTNKTQYTYQNYLEMDYKNEFDVVTLIYCDFGVLNSQDRATLLNKIYAALKPGGIFVMDAFTKEKYSEFCESRTINFESGGFWNGGEYACIQSNYRYDDSATYLEQYVVVMDDTCECYNIWNHAFDTAELKKALQSAGFQITNFYGDVGGAAYSDKIETICAVSKKR